MKLITNITMERFTPKQMAVTLENLSLVQWLALTFDGLDIVAFEIVNLAVRFSFGGEER